MKQFSFDISTTCDNEFTKDDFTDFKEDRKIKIYCDMPGY